jgi:hypothetical protein
MDDVHGRAVTGGSFPAEMWHDFMQRWLDSTGAEAGNFPSVTSFPGSILNSELSITTSTLPFCGAEPSEGSTTVPCRTTTTTAPPETTTSLPPETSTTVAPETTTTATTLLPAPPPP